MTSETNARPQEPAPLPPRPVGPPDGAADLPAHAGPPAPTGSPAHTGPPPTNPTGQGGQRHRSSRAPRTTRRATWPSIRVGSRWSAPGTWG